MSGIFISYRRSDSKGFTGAIRRQIDQFFDPDDVFMDIEDIAPGRDFVEELETALHMCDVVIVVIGERWLTVTDRDGNRRLDDPDDFVRREIAGALESGVTVMPVLVGDAKMPAAEELPDPLKALARRNAMELSNSRWDYDMKVFIEALREELGPLFGRIGLGTVKRSAPLSVAKVVGGPFILIGVAALCVAAWLFWSNLSFSRGAVEVEATVDELVEVRRKESLPSFCPVFRVTAADGTSHRLQHGVCSRPASFRVGETVTLLHQPGNLEPFKVDSKWLWLAPVLVALPGLLFAGVGAAVWRFM